MTDTQPERFELSDSDIPRESAPDLRDTDTAPARCKKCGINPVVRTGKGGRPPLYCDECKGQPSGKGSAKATGSKSAVSGKSWPRATEIETILCGYVGYFGMGLQLVNPEDGKIIATGGPVVVHELIELAKTDAKLRKPLEMLATPGKYGPLGLALMGVIVPIMVNHGLLPQFQIPGLTPTPNLKAV